MNHRIPFYCRRLVFALGFVFSVPCLAAFATGFVDFESATQTGALSHNVTTADGNFVVTTANASGMFHLANPGRDEVYINDTTGTSSTQAFTVSTTGSASAASFLLNSINFSENPSGTVHGYTGNIVVTGYNASSSQVAIYSVAASTFPSNFLATGGGYTLDLSATDFASTPVKSFTVTYTPSSDRPDTLRIDRFNITVDTTPPALPGTPDLDPLSDTGVSSVDNITLDTMPLFTGTAEANSTVTVISNLDGTLGTTTADGTGLWGFAPGSPLSEGTHSITVTATDAFGNTSIASAALLVTIDTTAPDPPGTPDMDGASDDGVSNTDNITSITTPAFNSTADPNVAILVISNVDGPLGYIIADGSGNWSFTPSAPLSAGTHLITAEASDDAGNVSSDSAALTITITSGGNNAPRFTGGAALGAVAQDTANPAGATITSLLGTKFSDPDSGNALAGIAVTADAANSGTEGAWQYSTDAGTTWFDIGSVSTSSALLLNTSTLLRFLPVASYNGTPGSLTVYAVDNSAATTFTSGSSRQTFDTTSDDATSKVAASGVALGTSITAPNPGPVVVRVAVPAAGTYLAGANLDFTITFDSNVTITGTPQLALTIGSATVQASFSSSPTATTALFRYTVVAGLNDSDGIAVGDLTLNGGRIRNAHGDDATLTLNSVGSTANVLVDSTPPTVSSIARQIPVTVATTSASVKWRVTFSEAVTGVRASDFTLTTVSGTAGGTIGIVTTVSNSAYDVVVTPSGLGQLRLDLKPTGTAIADFAGNAISGGFTTGDFYYVGVTSVFDSVSLATGTTRTVSNTPTSKAAQRFTTASTSPLTLTAVTAAVGAVTGSPTPVVTICADHAGAPDLRTVVATLTNPASLTANALNVWTVKTLLAASTTYWVVFADTSAAGAYDIKETAATVGGTGTWLTNSDYTYFYGANAATGPQAGALKIALGATTTPAITSGLTAGGSYGTAFTYTITATNAPTSFGATGLPTGLTVIPDTGVIMGTPTQTGTFNVALTATSGDNTSPSATLVLTIAKAELTVTADDASRTYGAHNPSFTVSYSGFVLEDTAASLTTAPTATTLATTASDAGTYAITVDGGVASNYVFTYVPGILTVGRASQTILSFTANTVVHYGDTDPLVATASSGLPVSFTLVSGPATLSGRVVTPTGFGTVTVRASQVGNGNYGAATPVDLAVEVVPSPPTPTPTPTPGSTLTLTVGSGSLGLDSQWQRNGDDLTGATGPTLTLDNVQPPSAGLYTYTATIPGGSSGTSDPVIVGISTTAKVIGTGTDVGENIVHPNGNIYDQVLLQGPAATVTADRAQVTRISFVDLSNDIVQVEFSGAGTLSVTMDGASSPSPASNYNQPGVDYVQGHAGLVITGANETSNVSVFTVGPVTAVNQSLFKPGVIYDGVADIAFIAIQSTNGRFGGVRTANASYFAATGFTGVYAPGVRFIGPVYVGDINAHDSATPVLILGSASDTRITGGDLLQANGQPVKVSGITQLKFVDGATSEGVVLAAQRNAATLVQDGVDVTAQIVVDPNH